MYIIFTYDVGKKRVNKVMKTCRKYLKHVQNSVFEGMITDAKLEHLKGEVERIIDKDADAICIYKVNSIKFTSREQIGKVKSNSNVIG